MAKRAGFFGVIAALAASALAFEPNCSRAVPCPGQIVDGECIAECEGGQCSRDAASGVPAGPGCSTNAGCDAARGYACVGGTCRAACESHFDCAAIGECVPGTDSAGVAGTFCEATQPAAVGQFYTRCPGAGVDAGPYVTECDSAHGFTCVGSGAGDLDAYCTRDCTGDSECPDGFYCGSVSRPPCEDACGLVGNKLDHTCVEASEIGPGMPYQCDSYGVTRRLCRAREFCSSCSKDSDCLAVPNGVCRKDPSGASICTQLCDPQHPSCPWGSATVCGKWSGSTEATCAHRFGKCVGTGKGCEPCVRSSDCGPSGLCTSSNFTGERWCIDVSAGCSCNGAADANGLCAGGGCPPAPSGLQMICIDDAMSSLDGACYGANTAQNLLLMSQQTGCWPAH